MADTLTSLANLATWTRRDPAVVAADPLAQMVLEMATELVTSKAAIPSTWPTDPTLVPARARTICLLVAGRTYTNTRSVVSSAVGPISETILAEMAAAMQLTDAEEEELEGLAGDNGDAFAGLWTITTTRGEEPDLPVIALPDNSGSDWLIPYAVPGETGALDPEDA